MSSYTSTEVRVPTKREIWQRGLTSFKRYENILDKDLSKTKYWNTPILNNRKCASYKEEFKEIYKGWVKSRADSSFMREIESRLDSFIFNLRERLTFEYKKIQEDEFKKELEKISIEEKKLEIEFKSLNNKEIDDTFDKKIVEVLVKIKQYDKDIYAQELKEFREIEKLHTQIKKLFFNNLRIKFYDIKKKITLTEIYKENIEDLYKETQNIIDKGLKHEVEHLLKQKYITKTQYEYLSRNLKELNQRYISKRSLIENLLNIFADQDYLDIDREEFFRKMLENDVVYIPLKDDREYQVLIKLNGNKLFSRFIRVVDNLEITDAQKIEDRENLSRWCKFQDDSIKKLSENYNLEYQILEDVESDVLYILSKEHNRKEVIKNENKIRKQENFARK
jgi:hypothetical protein